MVLAEAKRRRFAREGDSVVMPGELRTAFTVVWLIVSGALSSAIAAPFLLSQDTVLSLGAALQSQAHDQGTCALCGMTRAFVAISEGDFARAFLLNPGSIPLYLAIAVNSLCAAFHLSKLFWRSLPLRRSVKH